MKPVVLVGQKGITDAVIKEIDGALLAHELIKVRLRGSEDADTDAAAVAEKTSAEVIAVRGNVAILFRPHPERPRIELQRA
jgi:RNA-binding protein